MLHIHNELWDFPPRVYSQGSELLDELLHHPAIHRLDPRLEEAVVAIDPHERIITTTKTSYRADYLIIATGVSPNHIPALDGCPCVLPTSFSTTAQAARVTGQEIAVVGGGDRALESAVNLSKYASHVHLLVRKNQLRARSQWKSRAEALPNLSIWWETEIAAYEARSGKIALMLQAGRPDSPSEITVDWILPRIGVHGNSDAFPMLGTFGDSYLQTDGFQRAGSPWIYALGDVCNGAPYASLSLAVGQAMKAVKHISLQIQQP